MIWVFTARALQAQRWESSNEGKSSSPALCFSQSHRSVSGCLGVEMVLFFPMESCKVGVQEKLSGTGMNPHPPCASPAPPPKKEEEIEEKGRVVEEKTIMRYTYLALLFLGLCCLGTKLCLLFSYLLAGCGHQIYL